ncbi:MAG: LysE family transporter [Candidatus Aquicultor sp.]
MEEKLELIVIFSTALAIALSGAMVPGPLLTVTIGETVKKGQKAAFLLILGHSILELLLVIGFTLGLSTLLNNLSIIRTIGILGGSFLLWMGYGMVMDTYRGRVSLSLEAGQEQARFGPVVQGIATSISNPYWTLWWATIGAKLVLDSLKHGWPGLTSFYLGHILGDFFWYGAVAYIIVTGKRFVTDRIYRGILFACGLFLVVLATTFIFNLPLF